MAECPALRGVDCFEPTVAMLPDGRLVAAPGGGALLAISNGTNWTTVPAPALPDGALIEAWPAGVHRGDNTLQVDPEGRLWYSAIVYPEDNFGQNVAGFQVAGSDDGGQSWAINHHFSLFQATPTVITGGDRQWLAFGPAGEVYASYWDFHKGQTYLATSVDGGATFGAFEAVPATIPGRPVVDASGALNFFSHSFRPAGYDVYRTFHDGSGWVTETVFETTEGSNGRLQAFGAYDGERLHVAWVEADGDVLVSSQTDGGWSEPVDWNTGDASSTSVFPLAFDGRLFVLSYETTTGLDVTLAAGNLTNLAAGPTERWVLASLPETSPSTDFAWMHADDTLGRLAVTWTHHEWGVRVLVPDV